MTFRFCPRGLNTVFSRLCLFWPAPALRATRSKTERGHATLERVLCMLPPLACPGLTPQLLCCFVSVGFGGPGPIRGRSPARVAAGAAPRATRFSCLRVARRCAPGLRFSYLFRAWSFACSVPLLLCRVCGEGAAVRGGESRGDKTDSTPWTVCVLCPSSRAGSV